MLKWCSGDIEAADGLLVKALEDSEWSEKFCADFRFLQEIQLLSTSEKAAWLMMVITAFGFNFEARFASKELQRVINEAWMHGKREYVVNVLARATEISFGKQSNMNRSSYQLEITRDNPNPYHTIWSTANPLHSNYSNLCVMKGQVQVELGQIDQAAQTFQDGIKVHSESMDSSYSFIYLYLAELEEKRENLIEARSVLQRARLNNDNWRRDSYWIDSINLELRAQELSKAKSLLKEALQRSFSKKEILAVKIIVEDRQKRKLIAVELLKEFDNNLHILLAIAKMFLSSGEIEKSRKWFNKTVECAPQFGDAWAYFYKLEHIFGNEHTKREVLERCAIANPQIGREFVRFKKEIANWGLKTTDELLRAITPRFFPMPT